MPFTSAGSPADSASDAPHVPEPVGEKRRMYTTAPRCEGQRMLRELGGTLAQLATPLGVSKPCVWRWLEGESVPGTESRQRIAVMYGIPTTAWAPTMQGRQRRVVTQLNALPAPAPIADDEADADPDEFDDADDDDDELAEDGPEPSVMDDCLEVVAMLRRDLKRGQLTVRERSQVMADFRRALAQKAEFETRRAMLESRIVREHPAWQRLQKLITDALLAHPQAARDVEAAINRALADEPTERPIT